MTLARPELEALYRNEEDPRVKERLLLILRVEGDGKVPAHVAKELHRSRPWTSYWLERYREEGVDGLSDKPREGRPPKLSEEVQTEIKKELSSRKQGWTTEQVTQLIAERGHVRYHFTHVYRLMHSKDDLLVLANYSSFEEFRKRIGEYFRTKRFNLDVANYLTAEPR